MATNNTIQIKKRAAGGAAGAPSTLAAAEPAYNEQDNTLYYGFGDNGSGVATSIIPIAGKGAFTDLASTQTVGGAKTFSSSPQVPTPATNDNTTNAASTAYVQANVALLAPLASPTFTGTPAAPTPTAGDNSTKLATTGFVSNAVNSAITGTFTFLGTIAASGSLPTPSSKGFYIISTAGTFTGTSVPLNVGDQIIYDQNSSGDLATNWDYVHATSNVASVFGRTGVIVAALGDYTTSLVTEGTNLYFTVARVLATALTGLSVATNSAITATDTVLSAFGKLQAQVTARLIVANNLSDLASASTARTNLGLGTAAVLASTAVAQTANNLSDLAAPATARSNLGLGTMATQAASAVTITGGSISGTTITGGTF